VGSEFSSSSFRSYFLEQQQPKYQYAPIRPRISTMLTSSIERTLHDSIPIFLSNTLHASKYASVGRTTKVKQCFKQCFLHGFLPTFHPTCSATYSATNSVTYSATNSVTYSATNSATYSFAYSPAYSLQNMLHATGSNTRHSLHGLLHGLLHSMLHTCFIAHAN